MLCHIESYFRFLIAIAFIITWFIPWKLNRKYARSGLYLRWHMVIIFLSLSAKSPFVYHMAAILWPLVALKVVCLSLAELETLGDLYPQWPNQDRMHTAQPIQFSICWCPSSVALHVLLILDILSAMLNSGYLRHRRVRKSNLVLLIALAQKILWIAL